MLNEIQGIAAPHSPHILKTFMPIIGQYGDLGIPGNFKQLVKDVCRFVSLNPIPWDIDMDPHTINARCKKPTLLEVFQRTYEYYAEMHQADYWICKSLGNVHFTETMEEAGLYPFYIYLYRDGRDVATSFKKSLAGEKHAYFIARNWAFDQEACLAFKNKIEPARFISICYEDLIADAEVVLRQICNMLGLRYSANALQFFTSTESLSTANSGEMWSNVTKPVIKDNCNKYLNGLTQEELFIFESVAHKPLISLGYELVNPLESLMGSFSERHIEVYGKINNQMKRNKMDQLKLEVAKRQGQLDLIQEISDRRKVYYDGAYAIQRHEMQHH